VSPLLSIACTRFGRRNVLLCGLIGLASSTVLFAVSSSMLLLALARIVQGVSAAANFTAGQAVLAHTFAGQSLGSILGSAAGWVPPVLPFVTDLLCCCRLHCRWAGLGLLLGPPLGGFLCAPNFTSLFPSQNLFRSYDIGGYQLPFLLGAGLAFIDVLVVALLMDDAVTVAAPAARDDDDSDFSWRDVLKHRCRHGMRAEQLVQQRQLRHA
jgi:MFS family permease